MTTLGQAYVQIMPSAKGISGSIQKVLDPEAKSAGDSAGQLAGSNLVGTITKIIAAAGIGKLLKDGISASLSQGAELQQNLGGTEAVFGEFASNIQNTAKTAYKNMGMSASDYMATANKMGSLFQGSGVEQKRAMEMSSDAMQRAADVASVMGVDMSMAMESVAGAAKGNFTMMDNLGVAMNATTLEAYALEKGMNFEWKTASNAEKAELAMKMFMDRTSQYAGNFAREASGTFSGSLDAMKGAWQNVLGNLALGEDLTEPLNGLAETVSWFLFNNLIPMVGNIVKSLPGALVTFFNAAKAQMIPKLQELLDAKGIKIDLSKLSLGGLSDMGKKVAASIGTALIALKSLSLAKGFKIPNPFAGLANMAKSAGNAVKSAFSGLGKGIATIFKGIGSAVSSVFQGIARAISTLNPAGVTSFALGLAAITAALAGLSLIQDQILPFLQGLSQILLNMLSGALQTVVSSLIQLQPVMLTIATALSTLSPLIVAIGQAFAEASPFVTALGDAIAQIVTIIVGSIPSIVASVAGLVTSISAGVAQIVESLTPVVQILSDTFVQIVTVISESIVSIVQTLAPYIPQITLMFTTLAQIISQTIVQIVQALAPFIPAVTQMVVALAPVLSQIVSAFNNLISQISPIIDSIGNLFVSLGESINSVLEGASSVVESFGSSIRNVLDGVAGIFDSLGNAALNAGQGVKLMAQGVKILTDLPLGDLTGTLASVAGGLAGIATSGIAEAGAGLQAAGTGIMLIATSGQMAQLALTMLPATITSFVTSLTGIDAILMTAGASISAFATGAVASLAGLAGANAQIAGFTRMIVKIATATKVANAGMASFNSNASMTSSTLATLGNNAVVAGRQTTSLGTLVSSAMSTSQTAVISAGTQMVVSMQTTMNQMKNVVSNGFASMTSTVRSQTTNMVSAFKSSISQLSSVAQSSVTQTRSALNQLGSINLSTHGQAVLTSFMNGMKSQWVATRSWVKEIAEWIDKNKGPISYDAKLLIPHGMAVMAGFLKGLITGFENVKSNVSSMAGIIADQVNGSLTEPFETSGYEASLTSKLSYGQMPKSVVPSSETESSQRTLIEKVEELIEEVRRSGNTYLDSDLISRKIDQRLGQNTQLRRRTSWA